MINLGSLNDLEKELKALLGGEFSSLTLSFNDLSAPSYGKVSDRIEDYSAMCDWVSEEERLRAVELNSCWVLQWYPNTPVGFNAIAASNLPALFQHLRLEEKET